MLNDLNLVLTDFKTQSSERLVKQKDLCNYTVWLMTAARCAHMNITEKKEANRIHDVVKREFFEYAVSDKIIKQRFVMKEVAEMLNSSQANVAFPPLYENMLQDPRGVMLDKRSDLFKKVAIDFLNECYENQQSAPSEVIHVTSMGSLIPTPLHHFLEKRNWVNTHSTNAYFFGCHAGIPALRLAIGSLLSSALSYTNEKKVVDIVHTEFLSIHVDFLDLSINNIISSTLFSDGFAKYSLQLMSNKNEITKGLKILYLNEQLLPSSIENMKWDPGPYQYRLFLSKDIPLVIEQHVLMFVENLCKSANINFHKEKDKLCFAIHPGGSKIIDVVQKKLELTDAQTELSRQFLLNYGNMSSATLPYLWQHIIDEKDIPSGTKILSLAFGPGMTVAGTIMEKL